MNKRLKIPIIIFSGVIIVVLIFFSVTVFTIQLDHENYLNQQILMEKEGPQIEITGFVDSVITVEGREYQFVPLPEELHKVKETQRTVLNLEASWIEPKQVILNPNLDGKKVRIEGVLKKSGNEYVEYMFSGFPIIITKKIEILEEPTINLVGTVQREKVDPDYAFKMVIDEEQSKIENKNQLEQLYLVGHSVPLGERGKVRIQGHILNDIENYEKGFWFGNFHEIEGPVIFVTDIQPLN